MASIKRVGYNRYQVRVNAGRDSKGKRRYPSKTVTGTLRQAEKYARDLETKRDMGALICESRVSVDEYLKQWLKVVANEIRKITLEYYSRTIDRHILPAFGHKRISQVQPYEVEEFYTSLIEKGLGAGSVRNIHAVLSKAFRRALRLKLLTTNPLSDVVPPTYSPLESPVFNPYEAAKFLQVARSDEHYLIFAFALHTGLRPEEYLGLKRSYLDLDHRDKQGRLRGLARVRQTVVINANGQGWYWSEPKTKKGVRDVFFPHWLAQEMKSHLAKQGAQKLALGRHYQDNDLVFATSLGTPHRRINVSRRHFKPILVEAKLSDRKLYSLRHSYATLSLLAGVDPKVVSEQMGHSNVAFTLNVYHHVLEGLREEGSDKLERLLELAEKTEEVHSESNES